MVDRPATPPTFAASAVRAAGRVKGTLLIARMRFLRDRGEERVARVLAGLEAGDRAVVTGMLLPSSWYPAEVLLRLETTIAAVVADGNRRQVFLEMGRFSADTALGPTGVQRAYLRQGDPHFVLRHVPRMYSSQHSDGQRVYQATSSHGAVIQAAGGPDTDAEDCLTLVGWLERAVVLSGGTGVRVEETSCCARGAACCEFRCEWSR